MEALGINLGYLIVQIATFFIMFLVLRAWAYEPILNMLANRRQSIEKGLEDARVAAEARANAEKAAQDILKEAQNKAATTVNEASARAEAAAKEILAQAEVEAAKKRDVAMAEATQERDRVLADVRGQVAALSIAVAQKLVGESLDAKRQHALIKEFFSGVKAGKVVVLEGAGVSGAAAEVTSALPLEVDEKESVKKDVLSRLGEHATITFRVDPNILGGLVIRVGDKVLDGSVAGQLDSLRQSLQ